MTNDFRRLPSVDRLLAAEPMRAAVAELGSEAVTEAVRAELAAVRAAIASGDEHIQAATGVEALAEAAAARAYAALRPSLRQVINATGVIIHTNLGRAPLSDAAIEAMRQAAQGYS